ncbi:MAG: hypothetical protein WDO74_29100 [Pseudomonadota bacterium]
MAIAKCFSSKVTPQAPSCGASSALPKLMPRMKPGTGSLATSTAGGSISATW